ncbi:unnamed protein product [Trichobilharzia regenti]|nr:unnamed protein product [Trichobilharzia regenti]
MYQGKLPLGLSTYSFAQRVTIGQTIFQNSTGRGKCIENPRLPSGTSSCSAQSIATRWLERSFELNNLSLIDYQRRVQELRRSVRQGIDSAATCTDGEFLQLSE